MMHFSKVSSQDPSVILLAYNQADEKPKKYATEILCLGGSFKNPVHRLNAIYEIDNKTTNCI